MTDIGKAIRALLKGRLEAVVTELPENGMPVAVRLLSESETSEANVEAYAFVARECRAKDVDVARYIEAHPDAFERAQIHAMLARAYRVAEDPSKPLFVGLTPRTSTEPGDHRGSLQGLDPSYINALWNVYLTHQDGKAPSKAIEEDAIGNAVAAMLAEPDLELALSQMDAATLVRFVRYTLKIAREARPTEE